MEKTNKDPSNEPSVIYFRHVTYTSTQIQDDNNLDDTFEMILTTPNLTSIELCTTYNLGTTNSQQNYLTV